MSFRVVNLNPTWARIWVSVHTPSTVWAVGVMRWSRLVNVWELLRFRKVAL